RLAGLVHIACRCALARRSTAAGRWLRTARRCTLYITAVILLRLRSWSTVCLTALLCSSATRLRAPWLRSTLIALGRSGFAVTGVRTIAVIRCRTLILRPVRRCVVPCSPTFVRAAGVISNVTLWPAVVRAVGCRTRTTVCLGDARCFLIAAGVCCSIRTVNGYRAVVYFRTSRAIGRPDVTDSDTAADVALDIATSRPAIIAIVVHDIGVINDRGPVVDVAVTVAPMP